MKKLWMMTSSIKHRPKRNCSYGRNDDEKSGRKFPGSAIGLQTPFYGAEALIHQYKCFFLFPENLMLLCLYNMCG